jgi:hypothetical protein
MAILKQVRGEDQPSPGQQAPRGRKSGLRQPEGHGPARQSEQPGQLLGREPLVRPRDRQQQRVAGDGIDLLESLSDDGAKASRFGMFDQRKQRAGRVILVRQDKAVHPLSPRVEEIVRSLRRERDVRDERQARQALLELANLLEVGRSAREQVHDRNANRLALADLQQTLPVLAPHDLMPVSDGGPKPLEVSGTRQ